MRRYTARRLGLAVLGLAFLLGGAASAWAQTADTAYSQRVDVTQFVPAPPGNPNVSAPLVVTLAYALFWVLALGFLLALWRRIRSLEGEVETARQRLAELDGRLAEGLKARGSGSGGP